MKASFLAILFGLSSLVSSLSWDKEFTLSDFNTMNTHQIFSDWSNSFNQSYNSIEEEAKKYITWLDNLFIISVTNSENLSYKLRLNQFSAMTSEEFKLYVHGKEGRCFKPNSKLIRNKNGKDIHYKSHSDVPAPASIDWTTKGVVTPVKNQGQCGSCWAFSATGAIECDYAINKGTLNSLSEQQLVDCAGIRYGCMGCNGGQMTGAMKYAAENGGLCSESEYKYTARNGNCKASTCGTKYDPNKSYSSVKPKSEPDMVTATVAGCVSIGIEADQTAFQHYSSGVLTGNCGTNIDHGVLIVGYGTSGNQDYWKVKNSWGATWGQKGYVLICRNCNKNNGAGECGILLEGNVPTF